MEKRRASRQEGFTIVEMAVVLFIMSILVGIAILSYSFSVTRSKQTVCRANLKTIRKAIAFYDALNGHKPATLYDLLPEYLDENCDFRCPYSHEEYSCDAETGKVSCPCHPDY